MPYGPQDGRTLFMFCYYWNLLSFPIVRGLVASNFFAFLSDFVFLDFFVFLAAIFVPLFSSSYFDYNQRTTSLMNWTSAEV
jgi:hypothetical protein